MIKYILPAIIIFLIVVFWEKITEIVFKKFNIRLNYIVVSAVLITIAIIFNIFISQLWINLINEKTFRDHCSGFVVEW